MAVFTLSQLAEPDKELEDVEPTFDKKEKTVFTLSELEVEHPLEEAKFETPITETLPADLSLAETGDPEANIPYQQQVDYASSVGVLDSIKQLGLGAGETLAMIATDLAGALAGTVAATVQGALSDEKGIEDAPDLINFMRETFRYEPKSVGGQTFEGVIGGLFGEVAKGGDILADKAIDAGAPPAVAAMVRIGPEALIMLAPFALRGKNISPVLDEVAVTKARARAANKTANIFTKQRQEALAADQLALDNLKAKPLTKITPEEVALIPELTAKVQEASTKLAKKHGLDYIRSADTNQILGKVSDVEIMTADLARVKELIKEAGEAAVKDGVESASSAKPIELVVNGTKTTVTSGLEELIAASTLGEKTVLARTTMPNPKPKAVQAMADKVNKVSEAERAATLKLIASTEKTVADKIRESYDLTQPLKARIRKSLPGHTWADIEARYIQLNNSGTSAAAFAKTHFEPIFSKMTGRKVLDREVGGKLVAMSDEMLLSEIVQSRIVTEISKPNRRPLHKFSGKTTRDDHQARLINLRRELGDVEYDRLLDISDEVFTVYKRLLTVRRDEGLLSPKQYNDLIDFNYSPRQYIDFFDPVIAKQGQHQIRGSGAVVDVLRDGSYDLTNISARHLLHDSIIRTHNIVARNRVLTELDAAVRANPESILAGLVKPIKPRKNAVTGKFEVLDTSVKEATKPAKGTERVDFFVGGERRALSIDASISAIWKSQAEISQLKTGTQMLRMLTGVSPVKALAVGLNPEFIVRDVPRAAVGVAFSNNTSMTGVPLFGAKNLAVQSVFGLPLTAAQMARNMSIVSKDALRHGPRFQELAAEGAFPRFVAEIALEEFRSAQKLALQAGANPQAMKFIGKVADTLSYTGIYAETVLRMAVAEQGKRVGLHIKQQAAESIRMVNFNESGYFTSAVDNFYPFFNARWQVARAQLRGFVDNPMRQAATSTSAGLLGAATMGISMGMTGYLQNWFTNPQAAGAIADEDLGNLNLTFPDTLTTLSPEGDLKYPYISVPIDGTAAPFVAYGAWMMRNFDVNRAPSSVIMPALSSAVFPFPDIAQSPIVSATLAVFGNFDTFTKGKIFAGAAGEPYNEYYAEHDDRHTPRIYVELGKKLWETGLIDDTALEGLSSPERLRSVVNSYLPSNLFSNAFSSIRTEIDPTKRELYLSNWEKLADAPIIGSVLNLTNPSINPMTDMEEAVGEQLVHNFAAKRSVDDMIFEVVKGTLSQGTMINSITSRFPNVTAEYRFALQKRGVVGVQVRKVYENMPSKSKEGLPGWRWWTNLASQPNQVEKARAYYKTWIRTKDPQKRRVMDNLSLRFSGVGHQYKIMDSDGKFTMELNRLKRTHGTDFVPGILLDDVDYSEQ